MERAAEATTGINRLPSRPHTDPAESSAALVSVSLSSFMASRKVEYRSGAKVLERRGQNGPAQIEDGEECAHDGGGSGNNDAGHNAHLSVSIAFADGVGS